MEGVVPFAALLLWLAVVVYMIVLATRLVNAVERIARTIDQHPPGRPQP